MRVNKDHHYLLCCEFLSIKLQFQGENSQPHSGQAANDRGFNGTACRLCSKLWGIFFLWLEGYFCPLKSILSPQIQHPGNIILDMTYFNFPRNIPWILAFINVLQPASPWGCLHKLVYLYLESGKNVIFVNFPLLLVN